jgi:hypothetical protein
MQSLRELYGDGDSLEYDICPKCGDQLSPWWVSNKCPCSELSETIESNEPTQNDINNSILEEIHPKIDQDVDIDNVLLIDLDPKKEAL